MKIIEKEENDNFLSVQELRLGQLFKFRHDKNTIYMKIHSIHSLNLHYVNIANGECYESVQQTNSIKNIVIVNGAFVVDYKDENDSSRKTT